ncbi:hypothetical protein KCV04_g10827, partial [Aureobasidium melanogenum]
MPSRILLRDTFDFNAFMIGLRRLSTEIANSPILAPYRPLELVSCGGFVSVMHLGNRTSTHDFDFFLNKRTYGRHYEAVRQELLFLIGKVAQALRYKSDWANDEVKFFLTLLNDPEALFIESKRQMRPIYQNRDLKIYAVKWEWALARKLKRLQRPFRLQKPQDWLDCVSITTLLLNREGAQLLRSLGHLFFREVSACICSRLSRKK